MINANNKHWQKDNQLFPNMRFQDRDAEILFSIQHYDGVLSRRQIRQLFWTDRGLRAMARRLSKLHHNQYVVWPTREHRRLYAIPEPIVWLGWRGAVYLAGHMGIQLILPESFNENRIRVLQKKLRDLGFHWYREPRWNQLYHDLKMNDIRLKIEDSARSVANIDLEEWRNESAFRMDMDTVEYSITSPDRSTTTKKRGVCPDGMFTLIDKTRRSKGLPYRARFLVELDLSTHDNPSFGLEKVAPGAAYIKSTKYHTRFGSNNGRWLIITTGELRMKHLMQQTQLRVKQDADLFLFSTIEAVLSHNPLTEPIWQTPGGVELSKLLTE